MKKIRTGLAAESIEFAKAGGISHSAKTKTVKEKACTVTTVIIDNEEDAKILGREKGKYVTVEMNKVFEITDNDFENIVSTLANTVRSLIDHKSDERVLIVGIGNRNITADSLGPKCVDRIMVTRGLETALPELIGEGGFTSVCAVCANVFGVTGIESAEMIDGIARIINPALIIAIDALATASVTRLCKTIQISNTSLTPGEGVDNSRKEISPDSLGIPVISIGMPTVIDVRTILSNAGIDDESICDMLFDYADSLIAIPPNIDGATDTAAKLIAFSLNKAFHYDMSTEDILKFLY